jgi:6-phosphogluconate dehydrogenase (decarboxylating)
MEFNSKFEDMIKKTLLIRKLRFARIYFLDTGGQGGVLHFNNFGFCLFVK